MTIKGTLLSSIPIVKAFFEASKWAKHLRFGGNGGEL